MHGPMGSCKNSNQLSFIVVDFIMDRAAAFCVVATSNLAYRGWERRRSLACEILEAFLRSQSA